MITCVLLDEHDFDEIEICRRNLLLERSCCVLLNKSCTTMTEYFGTITLDSLQKA